MSFFDRKEDVLDFELTQYGKYLLSKGELKAEYYAFFDDDVLYDASYAQITESENTIQDRILENTPQLRPQYSYTGVETTSSNGIKKRTIEEQNSIDKEYSLVMPLGTVGVTNNSYPAFNLNLIRGYIDNVITSSDVNQINGLRPVSNIPKINLKYNIYNVDIVNDYEEIKPGYKIIYEDFDNNKITTYSESYNLFDLIEKNTEDLIENFDIEIFKQESEDKFTKLKFVKKPTYIKNGILLDKPENKDLENIIKYVTPENVEWYFNILVDEEIDFSNINKDASSAYSSNVTINDKPFGDAC